MRESLPRADAAFLQWSRQFQIKVAADPQRYDFTPEQAAALTDAWDAFDAAYQRMHNPDTRTSPNAQAKRSARDRLERIIRSMAQMARANRATLDADILAEVGLRRPSRLRTRIARPADPPRLQLVDFDGSTVRLALADAGAPTGRGKPRGTNGAIIFVHIGDDGRRTGIHMTNRPQLTLSLADPGPRPGRAHPATHAMPQLPPGTRIRINACWTNPRHQQGPMSNALELRTGYPILMHGA